MNLAELLITQARQRPQTAALVDVRRGRRRAMAFAELDAAAAQAARSLSLAGLRPGDAVLVLQPMSVELYIALAAIFRLGLVAMFLDPTSGRDHIEECCALWSPRGLIASPKAHLLRVISPAVRHIPIQFCVGVSLPWAKRFAWAGAPPLAEAAKYAPATPATPALVTFTTGSTGRPKAALRTHGFLLNQLRVLQGCLQLRPGEVDFATLPTFALANLASGVTTIIPNADLRAPERIDPAAILRQIRDEAVTRIGAAPTFLERLIAFCSARSEALPSLTKIYTGGGPVFPSLLNDLQALSPNAQVTALYGCTEAEPIAQLNRADLTREDHARIAQGDGLLAGRISAELSARIVPDRRSPPVEGLTAAKFDSMCLPPGERGEIVVSGAHVLRGYLDPRENCHTKILVGDTVWHRTGDAGYVDGAGRLWLLGRCCARIQDNHGQIYPLEVESVVRERTRHCRAALVSDGGQRVLCVEREGSAELDKLQGALRTWHVGRVRVVPALPRDRRHRSKIDYAALIQRP